MNNSKTEIIINFFYKHRYTLSIIVILIFAAILRYSGYNWDGLHTIHPDERAIGFAVEKINFFKTIDPKFYAYGTLPIYLIKILSIILSVVDPIWNSYSFYVLSGRLISATAGIASIFIVYLIGKRLYSNTVGIFSSLFLTLTVSQIQDCHFATVDILLSFFITLTIYLLIDIFESKANIKRYFLVSGVIGLALAVKITALPLLVVFFISHVASLYRKKELFKIKAWQNTIILFIGCGLTTLIINFIAQPYAYINFIEYFDRIKDELRIAKTADICYDWQYLKTPFLLYYVKELLFRSMGVPLGLLSIIGFTIATVSSIIKPLKSRHILLLLWTIPYFITINTYQVKYIRYMEPLFPFFCLFAGYYYVELMKYLWTSKTKKVLAGIFSIILIGFTLFYALAFSTIYLKPHTYIEGSKWFYQNVPEKATLLTTHWDEGFPLPLKEKSPEMYKTLELKLYEHKGEELNSNKLNHIAENLEESDYFIAQSRRIYGTTLNVPEDFPITSKFYDMLFTERLGFKLIKEFTSYPGLFNIEINDDLSDESFSVYDHPKVLIFKKVKNLKKKDYSKILSQKEPLTMNKSKALQLRYTDNISIKRYTIIEELLITIFWVLIIELFSLMGLAIGHKLFKQAGLSLLFFSHLIGILSFSYTVWILSSLKFISYSFIFIAIIFFIGLTLSISYLLNNFNNIKGSLFKNIDTLTISKLTFISTFIIFLILRSLSPEIYWGEKPMDFGIFNNLISISTLPPTEIWYSGTSLSYYYFGHFIYATITKLTLIPSFFTYNLALATSAALLFNAAFGILYYISKKYLYGLISGIITVFLGNLSGLRELIYEKNPINFDFFWATSRVIPDTVNEYPLWGIIFGDLHAHISAAPMFMFLMFIGILIYRDFIDSKKLSITLIFSGAFVAGTIAVTNIWDMPTAIIILFATVTLCMLDNIISLFNFSDFKNLFYKAQLIIKNYAILLISLITGYIIYIPFWLNMKGSSDFNFGLLKKTEFLKIDDFAVVWGLFIFLIASFLSIELYKFIKKASTKEVNSIIYLLLALIVILIIAIFLKTSIIGNKTLLLNLFLLLFSLIVLFKTEEKENKIIIGYISLGLAILSCTSEFFIYDRMNTVFKYFMQTWYLFTISCTYIIYYIFNHGIKSFIDYKNNKIAIIKTIWLIPFTLLILASAFTSIISVFGFTKTNKVVTYKPIKTINGIKYLEYKCLTDYMAIDWIKNNIKQPAIILEAQNEKDGSYGDYARIVMNTGIPTVTGWEHHLTQRGIKREEIKERYKDVKTIYTTKDPDIAYDLLKKYQVNYIYVGTLEVDTYGFSNIFENNKSKFKKVYSNNKVRIYKVL